MGKKSRRAEAALKALHKVEEGRVKKPRKSEESAATQKIKADSINSTPAQKSSQSQKQLQIAEQPKHDASKTKPSSTQSSIKESQLPKDVILSESEWHPSKLKPDITSLYFRSTFDVRDHHLDLAVAAGAGFCYKLEEFSCGNDSTGYGSHLTDAAVTRLAAACPNLRKVYLTSVVNLTDNALLAFLTHCPQIHTLSITGNDKFNGKIKGSALKELKKNKGLAKYLRKLDLVDQGHIDGKILKSVCTARKHLVITMGNTSDKWYDFGSISTYKHGDWDEPEFDPDHFL